MSSVEHAAPALASEPERPRSVANGSRGLVWLIKRETLRVSKLWTQTVLAPIVSASLFIVVFGLSLGGRIKEIDGVPYKQFIVPGLIVMAMVQASYANNSASVFQARSDRYINDVLSAPMKPWQMNLGYNVGGWIRAGAIGLGMMVVAIIDHRRAGARAARARRRRGARAAALRRASGRSSGSSPRRSTTTSSSTTS